MSNIEITKAVEADRNGIAQCIAEGFEKDFSVLCKDIEVVAKAIENGIHIDRFYVAKTDTTIVGVVAVSDCFERAVTTDITSYRKHFGFLKGSFAKLVLKEEFDKKLNYPETTGYIEFVAVKKNYQRQGIASKILKFVMENGRYKDYVLEVTSINTAAQKCYENLGFVEYERVKEKHGKHKGFDARIYMKYSNS